jgi:hypothetical protein
MADLKDRTKAILPGPGATKIAFQTESYTSALQTAFNGAQTKEDIVAALNTPWVKIGNFSAATGTQDIVIRNLSLDYPTYLIRLADVSGDSQDSIHIVTSTDNGATFQTGVNEYAFTYYEQLSTGLSSTYDGTHTSIACTGSSSVREDGGTTMYLQVHDAMNSGLRTAFFWRGNIMTTTTTDWRYFQGSGSRGDREANNAFALRLDGGALWDSGTVDVYGRRNAVTE